MSRRFGALRGRAMKLAYRLSERIHPFELPIWYDAAYRLPMVSIGVERGLEPRRADYVAWFLLERAKVSERWFRRPERVSYAELARVHDRALLESLTTAEGLAQVFAVDPAEIPVEEVVRSIRLACGATVAAAREAVATRRATCNLLGGFHHATPTRAAGFCPVNDIAVAVAALRARGFDETVAVLDFDAHPPDGVAVCFEGDSAVSIGSLSGSDWGSMAEVDETVLAPGTGDDAYLVALDDLLGRMRPAALTFVIAGGDVLADDHLGQLGLSVAGVRKRDLRVAAALRGKASVWLPGGGYHRDAWRVLAGTTLAVGRASSRPIPRDYDPLDAHFAHIARRLGREDAALDDEYGLADLEAELFGRGMPAHRRRLLGHWSAAGLEYALFRFGIFDHVSRLGYRQFRVSIEPASLGECMRLFARAAAPPPCAEPAARDPEYLLMECVLERRQFGSREYLFVNWFTLRHPLVTVSSSRALLPGQDVPGLGLMREAGELLCTMAERINLVGVAFCPSHYHLAAGAMGAFEFFDPERQGRFDAMWRDLGHLPLLAVSQAVSDGKVHLNGSPYTWEASTMVRSLSAVGDGGAGGADGAGGAQGHTAEAAPGGSGDEQALQRRREAAAAARFTIADAE